MFTELEIGNITAALEKRLYKLTSKWNIYVEYEDDNNIFMILCNKKGLVSQKILYNIKKVHPEFLKELTGNICVMSGSIKIPYGFANKLKNEAVYTKTYLRQLIENKLHKDIANKFKLSAFLDFTIQSIEESYFGKALYNKLKENYIEILFKKSVAIDLEKECNIYLKEKYNLKQTLKMQNTIIFNRYEIKDINLMYTLLKLEGY